MLITHEVCYEFERSILKEQVVMKALGIILLILMAAITVRGEVEWIHLGDKFTIDEVTSIQELIEHPVKYHNKDVKIRGIITSVCNEEGCFIEVVSKDGIGEGIVVNFPGLKYTFPLDCAGLEAVVEGLFYQKIYPSARVVHWQHHSYRKGKKVPEFALIMRVAADAAKIGGSRAAIPLPAEIRNTSTHKIDLDIMEFEAEGFGIGKKKLEPGAVTPQHSTGKAREIVVCLQGSVTVYKEGSEPVILTSGEMAFIPPATAHEIRNEGEESAGYIFIYARKIEKEEHDH